MQLTHLGVRHVHEEIMARSARALLRAAPMTPLEHGAEAFIIETALAYPDPSQLGVHEEEHSLCVLVLIDPSDAARRLARVEAVRYVSARTFFINGHAGADWGIRLAEQLDQIPEAFIDMVIALPEHSPAREQQIS